MTGIDVSYAQGKIDWQGLAAEGVDFAMIKASQGKLLADATVGPFTDPRFHENIRLAHEARIPTGVYHYLCAHDEAEAVAEAEYFLAVITPYKKKIRLWAVCDAEEDKYLPRTRDACGAVVHAFMETVAAGGFTPMLYSNPNYLTYRLPDMKKYPLWLAYWGTTEANALRYNPKIWQYGTGSVGNLKTVDVNRGYFHSDTDGNAITDGVGDGIFQEDSRRDDGVLVSGGASGGSADGAGGDGGGVRPARRRSYLHRRTYERWRRHIHD